MPDQLNAGYVRLRHVLSGWAQRLHSVFGDDAEKTETLLISLPISKDRRRRLFSRLDRTTWGLSAIEACYPPNRESLTDAEWKRFHEMSEHLTTGQRGCFLSHRRAWRKVWESGSGLTIILEDDVVPLYEKLPPLPALPRDLDVLHLHHFAQYLPTAGQLLFGYLRAPIECVVHEFKIYRLDEILSSHCGRLSRATMPACAYGVTRSGAGKLLSIFDEVGNFYNWDSIMLRHGIGPSLFQKMLPYVCSDSCMFYQGLRPENASLRSSSVRLNTYAIYPPLVIHDYATPSVKKAVRDHDTESLAS